MNAFDSSNFAPDWLIKEYLTKPHITSFFLSLKILLFILIKFQSLELRHNLHRIVISSLIRCVSRKIRELNGIQLIFF